MIRTIYLIGFMGSGKSYLGRKLSLALNLDFIELDEEICRYAEKGINEIFRIYGESGFRELETQILTATTVGGIIATGGGVIESQVNRDFIRDRSDLTIWLDPGWKIIESRIMNSNRPLVKDLDLTDLKKLWIQRKEMYQECADLIYRGHDPQELLEMIKNYKKISPCFENKG